MVRARAVAAAALAAIAGVAIMPMAATGVAYAAEVALVEQWRAPAAAPANLEKILVVGISRNGEVRRRFEDHFVSLLRGRRSDGIPSYSLVPDLTHVPDPEAVLQTLFSRQVDGVITVFLDPLDDRSLDAWAAGWRARVETPVTVRDYVAEGLKAVGKDVTWFGAEFSLWSVESRQRLWAGRTDAERIGRLRKNAGDVVQTVINDLVYQKLLR
jgi:hypothetical protein